MWCEVTQYVCHNLLKMAKRSAIGQKRMLKLKDWYQTEHQQK